MSDDSSIINYVFTIIPSTYGLQVNSTVRLVYAFDSVPELGGWLTESNIQSLSSPS